MNVPLMLQLGTQGSYHLKRFDIHKCQRFVKKSVYFKVKRSVFSRKNDYFFRLKSVEKGVFFNIRNELMSSILYEIFMFSVSSLNMTTLCHWCLGTLGEQSWIILGGAGGFACNWKFGLTYIWPFSISVHQKMPPLYSDAQKYDHLHLASSS